ncbi:hypothetical protein [Vreelandella subterranea]|jgi:hypothetical protein|uniref:hypothetical protein n=1 Tax=Vreelandella subterranea TaxID=416874 RepID=UPI000B85BCAE|nr:hypothetical protein [Halomonas subterranea]
MVIKELFSSKNYGHQRAMVIKKSDQAFIQYMKSLAALPSFLLALRLDALSIVLLFRGKKVDDEIS